MRCDVCLEYVPDDVHARARHLFSKRHCHALRVTDDEREKRGLPRMFGNLNMRLPIEDEPKSK